MGGYIVGVLGLLEVFISCYVSMRLLFLCLHFLGVCFHRWPSGADPVLQSEQCSRISGEKNKSNTSLHYARNNHCCMVELFVTPLVHTRRLSQTLDRFAVLLCHYTCVRSFIIALDSAGPGRSYFIMNKRMKRKENTENAFVTTPLVFRQHTGLLFPVEMLPQN